jgi:hypothetical protein
LLLTQSGHRVLRGDTKSRVGCGNSITILRQRLHCRAIRKTDAMSNDDDNRRMFSRWRNSEVSRNFHRLGLLVAAIILMAGLLLMAKDALGLRLWDLIPADIPILASGIATGLTGIGLVSLAAYGFVRAIGWAIDKSI